MGLKRSTNSIPSSKICKTTAKLSSWTSTRWHTKWVPHKWRSILSMRIYVIVNKIWKTNRNFSKNVDFYINQKQNSATWSIRISTVSVNGCNLAQIEAKFDRSRNLILKFLHKNEEHRQAYLAVLLWERFLSCQNDRTTGNVAWVAIDRRKCIASRFHTNLLP